MGLVVFVMFLIWLSVLFSDVSEPKSTKMQPRPRQQKIGVAHSHHNLPQSKRLIAK